jgi:TRAP transporter T-component
MRRLVLIAVFATLAGCSTIRTGAVNVIGNAIADGGGGVYNSDSDPELVEEALPFGLKTYESLLAASPRHKGLLLASANGFTAYAYLLQQRADKLDAMDLAAAEALRHRASGLFLRGRDFALRGLDAAHAGFTEKLKRDSAMALADISKSDIAFLYWAGAALAGAASTDRDNSDLLADLPLAGALMGRVLELDDTYDKGSAHEFFIAYEAGRPGGDARKAREHYMRAVELSGGRRASVYLAMAEGVDVRQQNLMEFRAMIASALSVDPGLAPEMRLVNTIARRRAEWLNTRIADLFADAEEGATR